VARQNDLLHRFSLPLTLPDVPREALWEAMSLDKKARGGALRWVLLEGIGRGVVDQPVEPETVREVVEGLRG
jgi:3-dehydroquinate synthase